MKKATKKGFSFGLASGIITTLGMIVGLSSGTNSKIIVLGGILMIAIADALSDALGMHISTESEKENSQKSIWQSTRATFFSKLFFALTFVIPLLLFELQTAVIVSIVWGFSLISFLSYNIAKARKEKPWKSIFEHLTITTIVIIATYYIGLIISSVFV